MSFSEEEDAYNQGLDTPQTDFKKTSDIEDEGYEVTPSSSCSSENEDLGYPAHVKVHRVNVPGPNNPAHECYGGVVVNMIQLEDKLLVYFNQINTGVMARNLLSHQFFFK